MGTEILILIVIPGFVIFCWLIYRVLSQPPLQRAVYLAALLIALALGVLGMVNAYRPDIPANWNPSFLLGWFLMSSSFWLIVTSVCAAASVAAIKTLSANISERSREQT